MTVYRNKDNSTWYATFYYRDSKGLRHHKTKRGFETEAEALVWEHDFIAYHSGSMDMLLSDFTEHYIEDIAPRLKLNTLLTKHSIIEGKILPAFGRKRMSEITSRDILRWQNQPMDSTEDADSFSPTYIENDKQPALSNLQPCRSLLRFQSEPHDRRPSDGRQEGA